MGGSFVELIQGREENTSTENDYRLPEFSLPKRKYRLNETSL